jgi:hypothetical protein
MNISEQINKTIEAAGRLSNAFVERMTKSWKATAAVAIVLVGASVAFLIYALQDSKPRPVVTPPAEETATSTVNYLERALDGMLVDASSTRLLPLGVMVENSADAWPLQGPAKADVVFEAPVEGSITRYFLLFDASSTVDEIGPVRSARPYFVEWADAFHAMYVHVGGSPEALDNIKKDSDFQDLNEFFNGWAFWRAAKRTAPHNVFTRTELLLQAAEKKGYEAAPFRPWEYAEANTSTDRTVDVEEINVPYEGLYAAQWRYDKETDEYVRYRGNAMVRDADGTPIRVKNVVVMLTEAQVLDEIGRLRVRTTGRGKALVFSNGKKREGSWVRSAGQTLQFEGVDGSEITFSRGKTWISVLTGSDAFAKVRSTE